LVAQVDKGLRRTKTGVNLRQWHRVAERFRTANPNYMGFPGALVVGIEGGAINCPDLVVLLPGSAWSGEVNRLNFKRSNDPLHWRGRIKHDMSNTLGEGTPPELDLLAAI
jgi:hypothetical protein